jgi:hypothetical protein
MGTTGGRTPCGRSSAERAANRGPPGRHPAHPSRSPGHAVCHQAAAAADPGTPRYIMNANKQAFEFCYGGNRGLGMGMG